MILREMDGATKSERTIQVSGIIIIFLGVFSLAAKSEYRLKREMEQKRR